jgi:adenylate cyclase
VISGLENVAERNAEELALSEKLKLPGDIRLACQTRTTGEITFHRAVVDELDIEIISQHFEDQTGTALGRETDTAILFTDVANYTEFAASLPAYDVVHVLNRYYRTMNNIIEGHAGVISDVAGDGILALFGALEERENSVLDAIRAVKAMNEALVSFNAYLQPMYGWTFGVRAGIHYGRVVIGNFDTGRMRKVAAIGDAVNLASRIETANKDLGTRLLISADAYDRVAPDVHAVATDPVYLKGKEGTFVLHAVDV